MKRITFLLIYFILLFTHINSQNTELLEKYFYIIGQSTVSLTEKWGNPIMEEITQYGSMYKYKIDKSDFEFYIVDNKVVGVSLFLRPNNEDPVFFTYYVIYCHRLEKEGFTRVETSYDPGCISIDGNTHDFIKRYEIYDNLKKNDLSISMQLIRDHNNKLSLLALASLTSQKNIFKTKFELIRSFDFYNRISSDFDLLLKDWGKPDSRNFNNYDKSDIVTYYDTNCWGNYTFLSKENKIFKILYTFQGKNNNKSKELFNKYSKIFEEAGYKSEIIPIQGFTIRSLKYSKDNVSIKHTLFPMPKEGKYPNEEVYTVEITITN